MCDCGNNSVVVRHTLACLLSAALPRRPLTTAPSPLRSGKMLVPKKNRLLVYKYLFSEGVLFAEKDFNLPKHPELEVPNLQVIKLMQSFKSKGFVRETFAWRHYYWYLTNEGIEHLRDYLNLPSEIVPATLKKSSRPPGRPMGAGGDRPPRRFEGGRGYGDREGYRGYGAGGDDKAGAPGAYKPAFREAEDREAQRQMVRAAVERWRKEQRARDKREMNESMPNTQPPKGERFLLGPKITDWDEQRADYVRKHPGCNETRQGKARVMLVTGSQPGVCDNDVGDFLLLKSLKNKLDYCSPRDIQIYYSTAILDRSMDSFWIYYSTAILDRSMDSFWVKLPLLRKLMLSHAEVEWFWWMDSDAVFTGEGVVCSAVQRGESRFEEVLGVRCRGCWLTVSAVQEGKLMLSHAEVEWFCWMDSGALSMVRDMTFDVPFEKYEPHVHMVMHGYDSLVYGKKDWVGLNAGIYLIRNSQSVTFESTQNEVSFESTPMSPAPSPPPVELHTRVSRMPCGHLFAYQSVTFESTQIEVSFESTQNEVSFESTPMSPAPSPPPVELHTRVYTRPCGHLFAYKSESSVGSVRSEGGVPSLAPIPPLMPSSRISLLPPSSLSPIWSLGFMEDLAQFGVKWSLDFMEDLAQFGVKGPMRDAAGVKLFKELSGDDQSAIVWMMACHPEKYAKGIYLENTGTRPMFEGDDQSAIVWMMAYHPEKYAKGIHLESSFMLHSFWPTITPHYEELMDKHHPGYEELMDKHHPGTRSPPSTPDSYEELMDKHHPGNEELMDKHHPGYEELMDKYHPGYGDHRWPLITHFVGCKPCGKIGQIEYEETQRCVENMERWVHGWVRALVRC
ncbi:unnamed protein product [Closterium sp. NIES-65]|nr:unnamed protein product [Closterium sp. NIES-65]